MKHLAAVLLACLPILIMLWLLQRERRTALREILELERALEQQWAIKEAQMLRDTPACRLAPEGWFCTRVNGHEGPCAAWPYNYELLPK
jgi:hypothetical protein